MLVLDLKETKAVLTNWASEDELLMLVVRVLPFFLEIVSLCILQ